MIVELQNCWNSTIEEETSRSAVGFTAKIPSAKLTVTVDGYL
jgi:hypothetical protein